MKLYILFFLSLFFFIKSHSQTYDYSHRGESKNSIKVKLCTGANFTELDINNPTINNSSIDFGSKVGFHIGAELEYVLPSNNDKWSIFIQPNYVSFNNDIERELFSSTEEVKMESNSLNLPLGLRYYIHFNKNLKFFVSGMLNIQLASNTRIIYSLRTDLNSEANPTNAGFGLGSSLNGKLFFEARVYTKFNALKEYATWEGNYSQMSLIVSYAIL